MLCSIDEFRPTGCPEQELFDADFSGRRQLWDRCAVTALFPPDHDVAESMTIAESLMGDGTRLNYTMEEVIDAEWVAAVEASYQPIRVIGALLQSHCWSSVVPIKCLCNAAVAAVL